MTKENLAESSVDKTEQMKILDTSMDTPRKVGLFIFFLVFGVSLLVSYICIFLRADPAEILLVMPETL